MPIYEFECQACHEEFEELVMGGNASIHCPSCGSERVKKLMSAAAFKCNGNFVSTTSSGGCSGCSSHSCSSCG
jgi:putative FmdB family regulatory protein